MAPRAQIKQEKKDQVESLTQALKEAKSVVFVNYQGMDVAKIGEFRDAIRETGGKMLVAKNTLVKIAGKEAGYPVEALDNEILKGQTAMVIATDDAVAPIQILGKFAKEFEMPEIIAGVVDARFQNKEAVIAISKLPGKEALQAQVVGAVGAPLYGLVGSLQGNIQKLIYILEAKKGASPSGASA